MYKKLITLLITIFAVNIFIGGISFAQEMPPSPKIKKPSVISTALEAIIGPQDQKLKDFEAILSKVQTKKLITAQDFEAFDKNMYEYAEGMKTAFEKAISETELAAKTKGQEGNINSLEDFENIIKIHEKRVKGIEEKTKAIEGQLKLGTIKFERTLIDQMGPAERDEFKKFLAPKGLKEMEKFYPDLFKPMTPGAIKPGASIKPFENINLSDTLGSFCSSLPDQISNFLVAPAEASIALVCLSPCKSLKWSECAACVATKGQEAINAVNDLKNCWSNAATSSRWTRWAKKAACVVKLIAKLG